MNQRRIDAYIVENCELKDRIREKDKLIEKLRFKRKEMISK